MSNCPIQYNSPTYPCGSSLTYPYCMLLPNTCNPPFPPTNDTFDYVCDGTSHTLYQNYFSTYNYFEINNTGACSFVADVSYFISIATIETTKHIVQPGASWNFAHGLIVRLVVECSAFGACQGCQNPTDLPPCAGAYVLNYSATQCCNCN